MAWIAKKNGIIYGPYPDNVRDEMKAHPSIAGWRWEKVEDKVITPPIEPKKSKKKEAKSETTESGQIEQDSN